MTTLKSYCEKNQLQKKLILIENDYKQFEKIILEAVDMNQAVTLIKQLKSIDFVDMKTLSAARDAAIKDINAAVGGRSDQGLIRSLVNMFKSEKENPLIDALGFASALQKLFQNLSKFIEAHSTGVENANELSIQQLITGVDPLSADPTEAIRGASDEAKKSLNDLQKFIVNDFKPTGAMAKMGKSYVDKYMKNNIKGFARELMRSNVEDVLKVASNVTNSLKNASSLAQAALGASTSKQTSSSSGTEKTTVSEPSTSTKTSTETSASSKGEEGTPPQQSKDETVNKALKTMQNMIKASQLEDQTLNDTLLKALALTLYQKGMLK